MTTKCPACGSECEIEGKTTKYYVPKDQIKEAKKELEQTNDLDNDHDAALRAIHLSVTTKIKERKWS